MQKTEYKRRTANKKKIDCKRRTEITKNVLQAQDCKKLIKNIGLQKK